MSVLAIDYGSKDIGLAYKATDVSIAVPFGNLKNTEKLFAEIKALVEKENIQTIVVGMPWSMDGTASDQTRKTQQFVEQLKSEVKCDVQTTSEALSSVEAAGRELYKDASIHERSAMVILEDWIEQQ